MKTVAFVPVRGGSKSIPKKNIKPLHGKPLVFWVLHALEHAKSIDEIVLATDSDEIAEIVKTFNLSKVVIYHRQEENARDTSSTESVMLEYISATPEVKGNDLLILAQATSPFTTSEDFEKALEQYKTQRLDSLLTCARIKRFFWSESGESVNYNYSKRPRRQDFDGNLMENGAFYINTVSNIVKDQNRLSGKVGIYEMPEYTQLEIDEEWDWICAEGIFKKYLPAQPIKQQIRLVLSDVDGVLTDSGMYYSENGDELKKFSTYDGKAFELLRLNNIKTGIVTSEDRELNKRRANKLKLDYQFHGVQDKLRVVQELSDQLQIPLSNIAYIGDDVNDFEVLSAVGLAACPANAVEKIKNIPGILVINKKGGEGALRAFVDQYILQY